jgi:uncharacterized protein
MKIVLRLFSAVALCGFAILVQQGITFWMALTNIYAAGLAKHSYSLRHGRITLDGEREISLFELPIAGKGLLFGSLAAIAIVLIGTYTAKQDIRMSFAFKSPAWKKSLPWLGLFIVMGLLFNWLESNIPQLHSAAMDKMIQASMNHAFIAILGIGVLVPIFEELVFRGLLFTRIQELFSPMVTVLITALSFTVLHVQYNAAILVGMFCIGFLLGMLRWKSDSIWPGILVHCANNTIATFIAFNAASPG